MISDSTATTKWHMTCYLKIMTAEQGECLKRDVTR